MGYTHLESHKPKLFNGSSPLAWGIQYIAKGAENDVRFIPTRVGYTFGGSHQGSSHKRFIPTRVGYTKFPCVPYSSAIRFIPTRVGYTSADNWICSFGTGSSPLAWGIRRCTTGACPGKSVHPHSRGVYFIAFSLSIPPTGSSPLAWGILYGHDKDKSLRRFIPTRVGYTMPFLVIAYSNTVHPHSRGVYTKKIVDFTGFL